MWKSLLLMILDQSGLLEWLLVTQMEIACIPQVKDLLGGFHILRHTCQAFFFPSNFRFSNS